MSVRSGRWRRAAALGLSLLVLAGCSLAELAYDRAEWLTQREVARYVDLQPEQRLALQAALAELKTWHQREALPRYADALARLAAELDTPLSADDWRRWTAVLEGELRQLLTALQAQALPLVATLDDAQLAQFWDRQAAERERRQRRRPPERLAEHLQRDAQRQFRRWAGRPEAAQRALIEAWSQAQAARLAPVRDVQLAYWADRRTALETVLEDRSSPDFAHQWQSHFSEPALPAVIGAYQAETEAALMALLADLSASLSPRQRERARQQLREYAALARRLATPEGL